MKKQILKLLNKGTGAGGDTTNHNGKIFEEKTNNQTRLLETDYVKNNLIKNPKNIVIIFYQKNLKIKQLYV
jgi:hypothetical protein